MADKKLDLNLDAKEYIPKSKANQTSSQPTPLQPQKLHTSLSTSSKPFFPKNRKLNLTTTSSKPQPHPEPEKPKPKKIVREYFVLDEDDKQQFNFDYDYMISSTYPWKLLKFWKATSDDTSELGSLSR